ncbi:MAG: helix-turn-helix domain-containing protein [Euryarchaeota archaeon]|nr:helix-turn-helix domain-containing protein [Euryarchaeota archaeon]
MDARLSDAGSQRNAIENHLVANPGAHIAQVARALDLDWSTVEYHVRVLRKQGRIVEMRIDNRRVIVQNGRRADIDPMALMTPPRRSVYEALLQSGPATATALSERLGRARSGILRHLMRLEEDDLVVRRRQGRNVMFEAVRTGAGQSGETSRPEPASAASASRFVPFRSQAIFG